jgi:hypothetical protein
MCKDGLSWSIAFSKYNSGTYNNQYIILDSKKVHLRNETNHDIVSNEELQDGALYILEQIPGYIEYADMTQTLRENGNIDIFFLNTKYIFFL